MRLLLILASFISLSTVPVSSSLLGSLLPSLTSGNSASTPPMTYSSYRQIPLCSPSDYFRYPQSLEDVVAIVNEAISRNTTVKAFGARHSQTDIICTEGIPVSTYGLNWMSLNTTNNVATIGAGVILREATEFLRQNGRALKTTPAYGNITIGGAIGTGAHGSTIIHNASISSQVVGFQIVDGLGQVQYISSPDDLQAFRIHLGLLGFVVSVDIATSELYKTTAFNQVVPDTILTDGTLPGLLSQTDQASLYWFPSLGNVVVSNWTIVDVSTPGEAFTYDHVPSTSDPTNAALHVGAETLQNLTSNTCPDLAAVGYSGLRAVEVYFQNTLYRQTPGFVPIYTEDGETIENPATGYYDLMFAPTCRDDGQSTYQCVWAHPGFNITILDNEFTLALSDLPAYVTRVKTILGSLPGAFPLQGILMRFSAATDIFMSTAYGRASVHFEYYLPNRVDPYNNPGASLAVFQVMAQVATKDFGARSHWGKSGMVYQSSPMLDLKLDPVARAGFVSKMRQYDPNGIFLNNFGRRILQTGTAMDVDPAATRCALRDYCFCTSDSHCAANQVCADFPGFPQKKTCRTQNDNLVLGTMSLYTLNLDTSSPFSLTDIINAVVPQTLKATAQCLLPLPLIG